MQYYRMNPMYKTTSSGQTMTVILDLTNPDPTQWATYADDAIGMTAGSDAWDDFFGHYPCVLAGGGYYTSASTPYGTELGRLKRNDFTQYEDGTTAPTTRQVGPSWGEDAMICFPRRGIKLEYLDANTLSVSMTTEDNKTGYSYWAHTYSNSDAAIVNAPCDKFYLGAYKAGLRGYTFADGNLGSFTGVTPVTNQTIGDFRATAKRRPANVYGYELSGFFQLIYRQVMYLLKYKGQNPQIAIGRGFVDGNNAAHTTGGTNTRGMDWGESTGQDQMKLFGLEDFYGNIWEFIDGIRSDSNRCIWVSDGNFNDTGSLYISAGTSSFSSSINNYMRYPNGTNLAGFSPASQTYGTNSTYFCDGAFVDASRLAYFGGSWNDASDAGVFQLYVIPTASYSRANGGGRLMYMHVAS